MPRLTRCDATTPDGRRCCRPSHGDDVRHLVTTPILTRDAGLRIAGLWGYPAGAAAAAVAGFLSRGPQPSERFVHATETMANALLDAIAEKAARGAPVGGVQ